VESGDYRDVIGSRFSGGFRVLFDKWRKSQYRTVLLHVVCERAMHACRTFPTAANLTVKPGIGTQDADE